jgi:hypothetical protein
MEMKHSKIVLAEQVEEAGWVEKAENWVHFG